MSRLRAEGGFSLVESLMVSVLMVVVMGASLSIFSGMERSSARTREATDLQARARDAIDRVARDMRNLATPTTALPIAINKASATDVILIAVGDSMPAGSSNTRNLKRVRYCLDTTTRVLWSQTQTWTTAGSPTGTNPPPHASCPNGSGWNTTTPIATGVVGTSVFSFDRSLPSNPTLSTSPAANDVLSSIRTVTTTLSVDGDLTRPPAASTLSSAVVLRNQNKAPTAMFDVKLLGNNHAYLFATGSSDPEGQALSYEWYSGNPAAGGTRIPNCPGAVCDYAPPSGTYSYYLRAVDASGLTADAGPKTLVVP
jgi:type II secretory pathway pseudopilin PulG